MASAVTVRVLGPLEIERGGAAVDLGGPKQRALLAGLLASPGTPVPIDRLIDDLWGDAAPAQPASSLHAYVSHLRKALGTHPDGRPVLARRAGGYALDLGSAGLDAQVFTQRLDEARAAGRAGDQQRAVRGL